jgi:hypothetical protein
MKLLGALCIGLVLGLTSQVSAADADPKPAEFAKAKLSAARKAYESYWKGRKEGVGFDAETLYRWSRRWLDSQREVNSAKGDQLTAVKAHLERMKDLEKFVKQLVASGSKDGTLAQAAAGEFFRLEAELWLSQAKGK